MPPRRPRCRRSIVIGGPHLPTGPSMTDADDKRLQLYLFSRRKLLGRAARLTGDGSIAEDLLQDAWLRFDAAAAGQAQRETLPYLRTVVDNLIRDWRRRRSVRSSLFAESADAPFADVASLDPSPETHAIARDELRALAALLGTMPVRMRRAVEMHRLEGATLTQIAERLGVSVTTVHGLVVEGVARCRAALRDPG
jgi:RNA polymerase sigma factor (sigma-70 family)